MKINNSNPTPSPIQSKSDLVPNTLYIDKDGEVHITDAQGNLTLFIRPTGRVVPWGDLTDAHGIIASLRLVPFTGTISN